MSKELRFTEPIAEPERLILGTVNQQAAMGGNGGFDLPLSDVVASELPMDSPLIRDVGQPFSLEGFQEERHPFVIGQFALDILSKIPLETRIDGLPIKFPDTEYRVPNELEYLKPILGRCASVEAAINTDVSSYYAFITLQRTYVEAGQTQRSTTMHSDGLQGPRIQPKVAIEQGYQVVDRDPTIFFPGAIDMSGLDVDVHDITEAFRQRVDTRNRVQFPVGSLTMFDAYSVHAPASSQTEGPRSFLRLIYTPRPYDRLGNRVNALFAEEYKATGWEFAPRPIPTDLLPPPPLASSRNTTD